MLAICAIRPDRTIAVWNPHLEAIAGLEQQQVIDRSLETLPEPWPQILTRLLQGEENSLFGVELRSGVSLNLYRTPVDTGGIHREAASQLVIVENISAPQSMESRLFHKERLAFVGQVAAGVAHEIGNPVTAIACLAQNLKLDNENDATQVIADQILVQTERISTILQSLSYFVHGNTQGQRQWQRVTVKKCIDDAVQLLSLGNRMPGHQISNHCPEDLTVEGDEQRLSQVFVNILANSLEACTETTPINTRCFIDEQMVRIEITDAGPGIPPQHQANIFEPFYTTKDPGSGTGLGLAIARAIVNEHLGDISVESPIPMPTPDLPADTASGPGTRFIIRLPLRAHTRATEISGLTKY
ncbi:MAG: ATP-binding protein [Gammaproteobacteria bacterium]|nr:ATP-binding protein [Gammaproteobacteria bacterium]